MRTFEELTSADERAVVFTRFGLSIGSQMTVEACLQDWQEVMERITLADAVAEQTRKSFDDLRKAFVYGVFCYEIFTLVEDRALFVFEQALRDRFIELHGGRVVFEVDGVDEVVPATTYGAVFDFVQSNAGQNVKLLVVGSTSTKRLRFNGLLDHLRAWARNTGLLSGQRTQVVEDVLARMRNDAAHPSGYRVTMPVDTARTLSDLSEILNRLWGHNTPGGRLYPAPIERETVAIGWNEETNSIAWALAANLNDPAGWASYNRFAIVQAIWSGPGSDLSRYDSLFENSSQPADYLWGPGDYGAAVSWLKKSEVRRDIATTTDRSFAIREHAGKLYLPMRPEIAASQPPGHRAGHWHLVIADTPTDAFSHVRSLYTSGTKCGRASTCPGCYARNLAEGSLGAITAAAGVVVGDRARPPDFFVKGSFGAGLRHVELVP